MHRTCVRRIAVVALLGVLPHHVASGGDAVLSPERPGRAEFTDRRNPPPFMALEGEQQVAYTLGHAVFNTHWVPAGTADAARVDGLGPLFNSSSCDSCHNNGARGAGPSGDGPLPTALVLQLGTPGAHVGDPRSTTASGGTGPKGDPGDPRYGRILNTSAVDGHRPEAVVHVRYRERAGRYPDGSPWSLREPRYEITELSNGPLADSTVIRPRLASPLHGAGLLDAVRPQRSATMHHRRQRWTIAMPRAGRCARSGAPRRSGASATYRGREAGNLPARRPCP